MNKLQITGANWHHRSWRTVEISTIHWILELQTKHSSRGTSQHENETQRLKSTRTTVLSRIPERKQTAQTKVRRSNVHSWFSTIVFRTERKDTSRIHALAVHTRGSFISDDLLTLTVSRQWKWTFITDVFRDFGTDQSETVMRLESEIEWVITSKRSKYRNYDEDCPRHLLRQKWLCRPRSRIVRSTSIHVLDIVQKCQTRDTAMYEVCDQMRIKRRIITSWFGSSTLSLQIVFLSSIALRQCYHSRIGKIQDVRVSFWYRSVSGFDQWVHWTWPVCTFFSRKMTTSIPDPQK